MSAVWFSCAPRELAVTRVAHTLISTVFLPIAISEAQAFETMTFVNGASAEQHRYASWGAALRGHQEIVERVRVAVRPEDYPS